LSFQRTLESLSALLENKNWMTSSAVEKRLPPARE